MPPATQHQRVRFTARIEYANPSTTDTASSGEVARKPGEERVDHTRRASAGPAPSSRTPPWRWSRTSCESRARARRTRRRSAPNTCVLMLFVTTLKRAAGVQAVDEILDGRNEVRVERIEADLDTDFHAGLTGRSSGMSRRPGADRRAECRACSAKSGGSLPKKKPRTAYASLNTLRPQRYADQRSAS